MKNLEIIFRCFALVHLVSGFPIHFSVKGEWSSCRKQGEGSRRGEGMTLKRGRWLYPACHPWNSNGNLGVGKAFSKLPIYHFIWIMIQISSQLQLKLSFAKIQSFISIIRLSDLKWIGYIIGHIVSRQNGPCNSSDEQLLVYSLVVHHKSNLKKMIIFCKKQILFYLGR